jgi:hypothetical protein
MNHPTREEWVPFLYGESKREVRRQLQAHLGECADCRAQVEAWQESIQRLDRWKLPRRSRAIEWFVPALKWATATGLVLALGFGIGRSTAAGSDVEKLRARLEPQLRESLRQEMTQMVRDEVGRSVSTTLAAAGERAEKLLAAYNSVQETRRAEDLERLYVAIKKQLDTVAINTQNELVQLAGNSRPARPASSEEP